MPICEEIRPCKKQLVKSLSKAFFLGPVGVKKFWDPKIGVLHGNFMNKPQAQNCKS